VVDIDEVDARGVNIDQNLVRPGLGSLHFLIG
jgi:hypothetical protein